MRFCKGFFGFLALTGLLLSCDKVEQPTPSGTSPTDCYGSLYPDGDSTHYANNAKPTFSANTNSDRNLLIEDFTGHKCAGCSVAGVTAEEIAHDNDGRVFVSAIHAGPNGTASSGSLQFNGPAPYLHDFTCEEGLEIGYAFGNGLSGSPFVANPNGMISRMDAGSGYPLIHPSNWNLFVLGPLSTNDLKINIQSAKNYYPSTRGLFLHTEVELLDASLVNELKIVVQLHEDSIVKPQLVVFSSQDQADGDSTDLIDHLYVHRDGLKGMIDGKVFGQKLDLAHLDANGKYYFDYYYQLPAEYEASNMHLLIYVRDAVTEEIYQVIKQDID